MRSRLAAVLLASLLVPIGAGQVLAVHDTGMFELDGNVANNGNATYDWGSLFSSSGGQLVPPDPNNGPLLASTFVPDSAAPDPTWFTSNKDIEPIGSWGCTTVPSPVAHDDLLNAYAALVKVPANAPDNAGHTIVYLGSERASDDGVSFPGFWLLKNKSIGCSGSGGFSGAHTDGDILVLANYTNGGGTQNVQVYRWTGNDASGSPLAIPGLSGSTCGVATSDSACAIANSSTITSAWSPTSHASNTFAEAGIDLNVLLDATGGGCFSTFLAETRSAPEITATLGDFAVGGLDTCPAPSIVTTATPGGSQVAPGTAQHDEATVQTSSGRPTPTGSLKFFLCQPTDVTAAGCQSGSGIQVGGAVTLVNGSANSASTTDPTAPGKYCWRAEYAPDAAGALNYLPSSHTNATTECFTVVHASPTIGTQIALTGASAPGLGFTQLGDTAGLAGFVGSVTGETVTFRLYGPYASGVTPTCTGDPVFQTTGSLSAAGSATTSQTYDPTTVGTYVWVASYPGNALNDPATGKCTDANESATIVGAHIDVSKAANPPGPSSAGDRIGYDITVSNSGSVPATGTTVTDTLPAKANAAQSGDLNWSLNPAYPGCSITGALGSQMLDCSLGTVAGATTLPAIHVQSATSPVDCGVVSNKATVSTTNGTGGDSDTANITLQCPNLSLTKVADAPSVSAGATIGFTITASNSGAAATGSARNVVIDDPLPSGSGIDWSMASGPANCTIAGSPPQETLHCTALDLAAGQSESVHVTSSTTFSSCGTYPNSASLTTTNGSPLLASAATTVNCADLTLTKTADTASVSAGSTIGFTVSVVNSSAVGTGTATGVVIDDPLPSGAGVAWSKASGAANCSVTGTAPNQTLHCTAVDLGAGASETVHVTSGTSYASCAAYPNTASLTATNHPSLVAQASTRVDCPALTLTKTGDDDRVDAGDQIGFTVTAINSSKAGTGTAQGVVIDDPLPSGTGIDWSLASGSGNCTVNGAAPDQTLHCTAIALAPGESVTAHVVSATSSQSCATLQNAAGLTASNSPSMTAEAVTRVGCANLTLSKTADAGTVNAGDQIGFTITASNSIGAETGTAHGVAIDDPLPSGDGVDWSIASGPANCSIAGSPPAQILDCTAVDLAPGDSETVHVTSATRPSSAGTYRNTATLTATGSAAETASATTTVVAPPAVTLSKTADPNHLPASGGTVTYTYVVTNTGGVPIFDVAVRDDNGTPGNVSDDWAAPCPETSLNPGEAMTCTATLTGITRTTTNVATVTADWDSCMDQCSTPVAPVTDAVSVTVQSHPSETVPPTDMLTPTPSEPGGNSLVLLLIIFGAIGSVVGVVTRGRPRKR